MNVLIINNETVYLDKLRTLVPGEKTVCSWNTLKTIDYNQFDILILSGGSAFQIMGNEDLLEDEMIAIRNFKGPIIGICYGCEVIVKAFGGSLEQMHDNHKGFVEVNFLKKSFLKGAHALKAYENHHWRIKEIPPHFEVVATSIHGIEMISHISLPIYGIQFHPEQFVEETSGDELFMELFKSLTSRNFL